MRFYVGNSTGVNLQITSDGITLGRVATCNNGKTTHTIDTATDTDLIFRRNTTDVLKCGSFTEGAERYELFDVQPGSRFSSYHMYFLVVS